MSFAVMLIFAWALWAPGAFAGGQVFAPLAFLVGAAGFLMSPPKRFNWVAAALAAFLVWVCVSTVWSPMGGSLMSGSLAAGDFKIAAAPLRIAGTGFAAMGLANAALALSSTKTKAPRRVMIVSIGVLGVALVVTALFYDTVLSLLAPISDPVDSMPQNLGRAANLLALATPLAAASVWTLRAGGFARVTALVITISIAGFVFVRLDGMAALLSLGLAAIAGAVAALMSRNGFRALFSAAAAWVLAAPGVLGLIAAHAPTTALPLSFRARLFAWRASVEKVAEAPIAGHGVDASATWGERYMHRPDWLAQMPPEFGTARLIPNHPHSMALQIWAETGLIGAALAATTLLAAGWAIPRPSDMTPAGQIAAAGLFGAVGAQFLVSYGAWDEAFWGAVAIAATGAILIAKRRESA